MSCIARYPFEYPFIDKHYLDIIRLTVLEGDPVGTFEGDTEGLLLGANDGDAEGSLLGAREGDLLGELVSGFDPAETTVKSKSSASS